VPVDEPGYPVNLLVAGRRVLVVGGGAIAADKARGLLEAGAVVHVVASEVRDPVRALAEEGRLTWEERPYRRGDVDGHRLAVACTDDPATNRAVFDDGEAAGIWVNAADDPANCTYTLPARVRRGRLLVTVSTGGHSPALASWLRSRFDEELGEEYEVLLDLLAEARTELRAEGRSTEGLDWQGALDSGMLDLVRDGQTDEARERLRTLLGRVDATGSPVEETPP
jgi:precorrin-2 dehydrogenase / sirohydrochlorin ferrochelatase